MTTSEFAVLMPLSVGRGLFVTMEPAGTVMVG